MSNHDDSRVFRETSPGVELCVLRQHADNGMTFLVRMQRGCHAPLHVHPGGEETFMLRGTLKVTNRVDAKGAAVEDVEVQEGQYLFAPAGETHDGVAMTDALFLVVAPGGIARS